MRILIDLFYNVILNKWNMFANDCLCKFYIWFDLINQGFGLLIDLIFKLFFETFESGMNRV